MSKRSRERKEIIEGCAVDRLCDDPCRKEHKRNYNPATKETIQCPAYYRFYMDKRKVETSRRFRKKREKWVKVELR